MPSHDSHILRILGAAIESKYCLTPEQITERLNKELGGDAYTEAEIKKRLDALEEVCKSENRYCLKHKRREATAGFFK